MMSSIPLEVIKWVNSVRKIEKLLGSYEKIPSKTELEIAKIARKSIVSMRDLEIGDFVKPGDISIKRPGYGVSPKEYNNIIGKRIKKKILKDTVILWEDLE